MERVAVESRAIVEIGYDPHAQVLEVVFAPGQAGGAGSVYQYEGVEAGQVEDLFAAESLGRAVVTTIKGQYPVRKGSDLRAGLHNCLTGPVFTFQVRCLVCARRTDECECRCGLHGQMLAACACRFDLRMITLD